MSSNKGNRLIQDVFHEFTILSVFLLFPNSPLGRIVDNKMTITVSLTLVAVVLVPNLPAWESRNS